MGVQPTLQMATSDFSINFGKFGHATEFYHPVETEDAEFVSLRFYSTSPKFQQADTQIDLKHG